MRILVVDDNPEATELLQEVLRSGGATVLTAKSAAAGFEALLAENPDVLVSDIGMPDEDSFAFIRRVRALPASERGIIPALAVTAYARVEDRTRALGAGFDMYASKPIEPGEIIAVVATLASQFAERSAVS